jgi:hypothetical protein
MTRLAAILLAAAAFGQDDPGRPPVSGSVEFGYRWRLNNTGNFNSYRSVVNLGEGPKLFSSDLTFRDPSGKLFDESSLLMQSWGGEPYNNLRFDLRKSRAYNLLVDYRNIIYFNFLPSFANPLIESGSLMNQNSFDIRFRSTDVRLELLPSRRISPYIAYSRSSEDGAGIWDFLRLGNEYPVSTLISNRMDHYRGGVQFNYNRFHLSLEQGGTGFQDDQGAGETTPQSGNRRTPLLGQQLRLDSLAESYLVRGRADYSRGALAVTPVSWTTIAADFTYTNSKLDSFYRQDATGRFVVPWSLAAASGSVATSAGTAKMPRPSASVRGEVRPHERLRVVDVWSTDRLHNAASVLLVEQFAAAARSTGLETLTPDRLIGTHNQNEVLAFADLTKQFILRGGHRYTWGDAITASASVFNNQPLRSRMRRNVGLAGLAFRTEKTVRANVDFEGGSTSHAFFRTSPRDYRKFRARGSYAPWPGGSWSVSGDYSWLSNENPGPGANWDFGFRAATAVLEWFPNGGKRYRALAEYTRSTSRSRIDFIVPQHYIADRSNFREDANTGTILFTFQPGSLHARQPGLSLGGSVYASAGNRPTRYYQPRVRFSWPLHRNILWNAEWRWFAMSQRIYPIEDFASHQFVMSLTVMH